MSLALAGRSILVTRPLEQATGLAQEITQAGGKALILPAIEIQALSDEALAEQIDHLHEFALVIFISPNAAKHGVTAVSARRAFPLQLPLFALGPGTARALAQLGLPDVTYPADQDSEALLALPQLNHVAGLRILIFRGVGGRELLGDTLKTRGAQVEYAECYRRVCPVIEASPWLQLWATRGIDAVTIGSAESLRNLFSMLGKVGMAYLRVTPIFAPHEKIAVAARALGMEQVIATAGGDAGLVSGLITWFQTRI